MRSFIAKINREQIKDGEPGGAPPPATPPPATPPAEPPKAPVEPPAAPAAETDQFGYPIEKKPGDPPATPPVDPAAPPKLPDAKDLKENQTGYELDESKVEPPPAEPPKAPTEPPPPPTEFDKKFEKLPKPVAEEAKAEAKELGLEGEQLDKYVSRREVMVARNVAARQEAQRQAQADVQRQRAAWRDELVKDPTFGGQNFQANVVKAQKVLDDVMPATKKILTETKTVLPPYVMRDLASLYDRLHKSSTFTHGDPPAPPEPPAKDKLSEALEFYT